MKLSPPELLHGMWRKALAAANPEVCLAGSWPQEPAGRLAILACGKAAGAMATAAHRHYGNRCQGIVILPGGPDTEGRAIPGLRHYPSSHPVPDQRSVDAARQALRLAAELGPEDLLLVLLSGGGSALMSLPAKGLSLLDKQAISRQLLACGASIHEINCVRKHLSRIKGGRLALASRAPVRTLAISDVPGDDPSVIASGPTVADPTDLAGARTILRRYGIEAPDRVARALRDPANETPCSTDLESRSRFRIVASGMTALRAAAEFCGEHGIEAIVLGDDLEGDACRTAGDHAAQAIQLLESRHPVCLLSGGETTVRLSETPGLGGRNTVYALCLSLALQGRAGIWGLSADTDGIDGVGGHSGAVVGPETLQRAAQLGLDARDYLRRNDSATFFRLAGGLLCLGATGTNVNDFRAILVNA